MRRGPRFQAASGSAAAWAATVAAAVAAAVASAPVRAVAAASVAAGANRAGRTRGERSKGANPVDSRPFRFSEPRGRTGRPSGVLFLGLRLRRRLVTPGIRLRAGDDPRDIRIVLAGVARLVGLALLRLEAPGGLLLLLFLPRPLPGALVLCGSRFLHSSPPPSVL